MRERCASVSINTVPRLWSWSVFTKPAEMWPTGWPGAGLTQLADTNNTTLRMPRPRYRLRTAATLSSHTSTSVLKRPRRSHVLVSNICKNQENVSQYKISVKCCFKNHKFVHLSSQLQSIKTRTPLLHEHRSSEQQQGPEDDNGGQQR